MNRDVSNEVQLDLAIRIRSLDREVEGPGEHVTPHHQLTDPTDVVELAKYVCGIEDAPVFEHVKHVDMKETSLYFEEMLVVTVPLLALRVAATIDLKFSGLSATIHRDTMRSILNFHDANVFTHSDEMRAAMIHSPGWIKERERMIKVGDGFLQLINRQGSSLQVSREEMTRWQQVYAKETSKLIQLSDAIAMNERGIFVKASMLETLEVHLKKISYPLYRVFLYRGAMFFDDGKYFLEDQHFTEFTPH